jgi:hypothetical protein
VYIASLELAFCIVRLLGFCLCVGRASLTTLLVFVSYLFGTLIS